MAAGQGGWAGRGVRAIGNVYMHSCIYPHARQNLRAADHGEGLQVLRYQDGQKYEPHHDYFYDPVNARPENGGQRIVTVLMYL